LNTIGLLGTKFTMEMDFYKKHLDTAGINTIVPVEEDRQFIHDTIMGELLKEIVNPGSKQKFLHIIEGLENNGAQGIVLGCTEIPMLIKQADTHLPVFNTLELHAKAVAEFAVNG